MHRKEGLLFIGWLVWPYLLSIGFGLLTSIALRNFLVNVGIIPERALNVEDSDLVIPNQGQSNVSIEFDSNERFAGLAPWRVKLRACA